MGTQEKQTRLLLSCKNQPPRTQLEDRNVRTQNGTPPIMISRCLACAGTGRLLVRASATMRLVRRDKFENLLCDQVTHKIAANINLTRVFSTDRVFLHSHTRNIVFIDTSGFCRCETKNHEGSREGKRLLARIDWPPHFQPQK